MRGIKATPKSDADAIHDNVSGEIAAVTEKTTPVSADLLLIEDSADSNNKKRIQAGNLPAGSATDNDAIHDNVAGEISALTLVTAASGDHVLIEDASDSDNKKRVAASDFLGGGGGGGTPLLQRTAYNPGSQTIKSTTSTTFVDVDATNLTITFTAPSSGQVLVVLESFADISANGNIHQWNLRDSGGDVAGTGRTITRAADGARFRTSILVTGLTASTSYTYKFGYRVNAGTGRLIVGTAGNPVWGPAIMEVWEA